MWQINIGNQIYVLASDGWLWFHQLLLLHIISNFWRICCLFNIINYAYSIPSIDNINPSQYLSSSVTHYNIYTSSHLHCSYTHIYVQPHQKYIQQGCFSLYTAFNPIIPVTPYQKHPLRNINHRARTIDSEKPGVSQNRGRQKNAKHNRVSSPLSSVARVQKKLLLLLHEGYDKANSRYRCSSGSNSSHFLSPGELSNYSEIDVR